MVEASALASSTRTSFSYVTFLWIKCLVSVTLYLALWAQWSVSTDDSMSAVATLNTCCRVPLSTEAIRFKQWNVWNHGQSSSPWIQGSHELRSSRTRFMASNQHCPLTSTFGTKKLARPFLALILIWPRLMIARVKFHRSSLQLLETPYGKGHDNGNNVQIWNFWCLVYLSGYSRLRDRSNHNFEESLSEADAPRLYDKSSESFVRQVR